MMSRTKGGYQEFCDDSIEALVLQKAYDWEMCDVIGWPLTSSSFMWWNGVTSLMDNPQTSPILFEKYFSV